MDELGHDVTRGTNRGGRPPRSDDGDAVDPDVPHVWAAPLPAVTLGALAAVGLAAWTAAAEDPPGRLLIGLAAVALAVAALIGGIARPRLAARADALEMRGLTGRRAWPWVRVDAVRVVRVRRLGMPSAYLEVEARDDDGTERLLVMGRMELGSDPRDVAEALQHHRARAGRGGDPPQQPAPGDQPETPPGTQPGTRQRRTDSQ